MRELRPGYWQLRVFEGRDPITVKSKYRTRGFRGSKREAQRGLAELVTEVARGLGRGSAMSVHELLNAWLDHIASLGRSPSTLYNYRRLVMQLPEPFQATTLKKVTPKTLDDLYRHLGGAAARKPATVLRFHALLRAAFAQGVRWGLVDRNPAERATPPRVNRPEIAPPGVEEVIDVLEAAAHSRNPENAVVFRILAATGCRRGEVCGLQWSDLDLEADPPRLTIRRGVVGVGGQLVVQATKTHAIRTVGLDADTADLLRAHRRWAEELAAAAEVTLGDDQFVFTREPGGEEPLPPDRITQAWRRQADELGVKARLHDLRHLQASMLLDAGEAVTTVAARLGHKDTATTLKVYSHLMPGADERAAGIVGSALSKRQRGA